MDKTKKELRDYDSLYCPTVLIDGIEDIIARWPWKLNKAKILFYAAAYACEEGKLNYKNVNSIGKIKKAKVMVRVTEELEEKIKEIIGIHPELTTKTDFYVLALNEFLKKCNTLIIDMNTAFIAQDDQLDRGLVLKRVLEKLFPGKEDILLRVCEETFDSGDYVYCVASRHKIASFLFEQLFQDNKLKPLEIYPIPKHDK